MSHSQFRSETLILRHAWLNLWDKHMTTGRINQVTWWRTQCGRKKSTNWILPRGLQNLQSLQFENCISTFLRQSAEWFKLMKWTFKKWTHQLETLQRLNTMTNSRCLRIDLKLNRFATGTKCNPRKLKQQFEFITNSNRQTQLIHIDCSERWWTNWIHRYQDRILNHTSRRTLSPNFVLERTYTPR